MDIPVKRVALCEDFKAEASAMKAAIDDDMIMIVGSAPCFHHGVVDEIAELGEIALDTDVWYRSSNGWDGCFSILILR